MRCRAAICLGLLAAVGVVLAPAAVADDLVVDGTVDSTSGGFQFADGTVQTSAFGVYAEVVDVALSGADFSSIQTALDSILDASASKRYLVVVHPGIYDGQVTMKAFVDIQGSGRNVTRIRSAGFGDINTGTVMGADDAELRDLTVENTGGATHNNAIVCVSSSPAIRRVTAIATSTSTNDARALRLNVSDAVVEDLRAELIGGEIIGVGFFGGQAKVSGLRIDASGTSAVRGVLVSNSSAASLTRAQVSVETTGTFVQGISVLAGSEIILREVSVEASGGSSTNSALEVSDGLATVRQSRLAASGTPGYGLLVPSSTAGREITIEHSIVSGGTDAIEGATNMTIFAAVSQLIGGVNANGATVTCSAVYDESFLGYTGTCP